MESYIVRSELNYYKADYGQCYWGFNTAQTATELFPFRNMTSLVSIFNKANSGKKITINDIKVFNNDNCGTVSGTPKLIMAMATGIEGGYPVSPTKLNSTNANVEAGILVKKYGKSTQGNTLRRIGFAPLHTSQLYYYDFRHNGGNEDSNGRVLSSKSNTDTTPIILRYGEGISCKAIQTYYSNSLQICITVRDQNNGGFETVVYTIETNVTKDLDIFSIHNNESGKVIEIINIDINYKIPMNASAAGASDNNQNCGVLSVCKICGTTQGTGDTIEPIKLNSTNTLGDADIETKEHARTILMDQSGCGVTTLPAIHRISTLFNTEFATSNFERMMEVSKIKSNKFSPIILNEGEGIGIFPEIVPVGGIHDLIVEYTITEIPPPPSSGGETAYAYP